jgi:hypothetical protein
MRPLDDRLEEEETLGTRRKEGEMETPDVTSLARGSGGRAFAILFLRRTRRLGRGPPAA